MSKLLILGGTTEARLLCDAVASKGLDATVSLAGATSNPARLAVPFRIGGFGGAAGLTNWMSNQRINAMIDATHPFARQMPWNGVEACRRACVKRLRLLRPRFQGPCVSDRVDTLTEALNMLPMRSRVLVTTGRKHTEVFEGRPDLTIYLRTIEPVANLPSHVISLEQRPPFSLEDELALLRKHRIDTLISKDSGGVTAPKLMAAQTLELKTILLTRPNQPPGPTVQTVDQAVAWLHDVVGFGS